MLSLTLITWRLGSVSAQNFEYLIQKLFKHDQYQLDLDSPFNDIFYLSTCQRIVLLSAVPETQFRKFYLKWTDVNDVDPALVQEPELFHDMDALLHLTRVISGLDSLVIGEDQIQGQFKDAYTRATPFLSPYLDSIIQKVLRVGKRVRQRSLLEQGQTSTISVVADFLSDQLSQVRSVAIIGTGKMAKGILNYLSEYYPDLPITLFTQVKERSGQKLLQYDIEEFDNLRYFDVIFTATSYSGIINDQLVLEKQLQHSLIVDLGMPRNCVIYQSDVRLWTLEQIINRVEKEDNNHLLHSANTILRDELEQVKLDLLKQQHSDKIKKLRQDMLNAANLKKEAILDSTDHTDKKLDQLVNTLIHISQEHLETYLMMEKSS